MRAAGICLLALLAPGTGWATTAPGPSEEDLAARELEVEGLLAEERMASARERVQTLATTAPPDLLDDQGAWTLGLMHMRVGMGRASLGYMQRVVDIGAHRRADAGVLATGMLSPPLAEREAGALYALGQDVEAARRLHTCNALLPKGMRGCAPWRLFEVAMARKDLEAVERLTRQWQASMERPPLAVLRACLAAAQARGDASAIAAWRARIVVRGGRVDPPASVTQPGAADAQETAHPRTGGGGPWAFAALTLGLVGVVWWRQRRTGEETAD